MKKFKFHFIILGIFAFITTSVFAQSQTRKITQPDTILVEIKGYDITSKDLSDKIDNLPTSNRGRYKSVEGQKQILEMMITEQVFLKNAVELGIDKREDVKIAIHQALRPVVNEIYYDELLGMEPKITTTELKKYYNENLKNYTIEPRVSIQHLQIREEDLDRVRDMIKLNDVNFVAIIDQYSTNQNSASTKGLIRNIRLNGHISGIGADTQLDSHILEAVVSDQIIHGPFTTQTGIHFFKKLDFEPTIVRPFEEVSDDIESRLSIQREQAYYAKLMENLYKKYKVVTNYDIIPQNIYETPPDQMSKNILSGTHEDISFTLGEYMQALRTAMHEREDIEQPHVRERILKKESDSRVMYAAALDAKIPTRKKDDYQLQQVVLATTLSHWYNIEVYGKIVVSEEEVLKYYHDNIDRITIPASRNIRQFVSADEKEAKKHHKTIAGLLKKNQTEKIIELIKKESKKPEGDGILQNIYANGIIPGIGRDEVYNSKVWSTKVGTLSDIFKNSRNEIIFFYIVSETAPFIRPLAEVELSMRTNVHRQKANEYFEGLKTQLADEYKVVRQYDLLKSRITPEELFILAEDSQRRSAYTEAVNIYDQIINDFSTSEHAYRALFMKAFIIAENIGDTDKALKFFEECLTKYPNGDLNEAIEFMMESLKSGDLPEFLMLEQ